MVINSGTNSTNGTETKMDEENGKPILIIARKWAAEIDREWKLLASILYRFKRAEYHNESNEDFSVIFSNSDSPVKFQNIHPETVELSTGKIVTIQY